MGYAPTALLTAQGEHLVLNWARDILRKPGVHASEVKVAPWRIDFTRLAIVDVELTRANAYIFCDWFPTIDSYVIHTS